MTTSSVPTLAPVLCPLPSLTIEQTPPSTDLLVASLSLPRASPIPTPRRGVDYRNKVVLAPMVRSGELPSRLLALHYGADLVWGPETVDRSMIGTIERQNPRTGCLEWSRTPSHNNAKMDPAKANKESILYRIDPVREKDRLIYQIGTSSPTTAVQSASLVAPYVAGIDVNAGCPKPFSTSGGMGAALLRTPDLLASILTALVKEVGKPHEIGISVKIRLLETPEMTSSLVHKLCSTGITGLTVHCRTTPMRPRERAIRQQLRMIGAICHSYGVACLMNGDVSSREEGVALASEYGVDGAMIATAAEANSSVFRTKEEGGPLTWRDVVKQYMKYAISVENKWGNTKFLLSQLMPGKDKSYQAITMSKSYSESLKILSIDDADMLESAKAVDEVLGLDGSILSRTEARKEKQRQHEEQQKEKSRQARQKRVLDDSGDLSAKWDLAADDGKSKRQKAEDAAENAGFEGAGRGAMAVAV